MISLLARSKSDAPLRLLCVGAHCDDVAIGCGATLLALQGQSAHIVIDWLVLSGDSMRQREEGRAMTAFVSRRARGQLVFGDFPDGRLPTRYGDVKDFIGAAKARLGRHDAVLCHERDDRHQDHRLVNEMVWNTFRDHLVLEYEIPKWDGGLGTPNVYVPVSRAQAEGKARKLLRAYPSQCARDWFTTETFMALSRLRGIECRSPSGFAEAFHGRKIRITAA